MVKYFLQTKGVLLYEENPGRLPAPAGHAAAYLAEMPALEVRTSRYLKQALLAQHYQELLQSHCVPDYLRLFKGISCKERQRKNSGKKLNLSPAQPNQSPPRVAAFTIHTKAYQPRIQARRLRAGLFISAQIARNARLCYNTLIYDYIPARGGTI